MDYRRIQRRSARKSIEDMLYSEYPDLFDGSKAWLMMKPEYRGISDILNGMSGGKIDFGYYHQDEYWNRPGMIQSEVWAQYGRMYYSGNERVLGVLKELFPETTKEFERVIKEMVK